MIVLGVFNGLIFLPVFLAFLGPPGDVIPNESSEAIAPPTPDVSHNKKNGQRPRIHIKNNPQRPMSQPLSKRHNSDLSLSTIDEESQSYQTSSQSDQQASNPVNIGGGTSVFLEPEVVVETTTIPNPQVCSHKT